MARIIALVAAPLRASQVEMVLRSVIVSCCALALILAGQVPAFT